MSKLFKKAITVLSFGAGQDSTTLLYKFILDSQFKSAYQGDTDLICIFSDTGNEHPETYRHLRYCKGLAEQNGIEFYHLTPDLGYHSDAWVDLVSQMERTKTIAMKGSKSCTDNLKIRPIYRFLNDYVGRRYGWDLPNADYGKKNLIKYEEIFGKISMIIGIAKGEEKRKLKADKSWPTFAGWLQKTIKRVYPLLSIGYSRSDCQDFMSASPYESCIPSNCMMCPYIAKQELLLLSITNPEIVSKWQELEKIKMDRFKDSKTNNGVFNTKKTIAEHIADAKVKFKKMSLQDLKDYKNSHGHCISNAM